MKFIKEFSQWNPTLRKKVIEFIDDNKPNLKKLWDDSKTEDENIKSLIDYFMDNPDEMSSYLNSDNIQTILPSSSIKNMAPVLQNIGGVKDFKSF